MMPSEPTRDIMRRTITNLEFIEKHATDRDGPYEVTQLINSFLGTLAHPWEKYKPELNEMPLSCSEGRPRLPKEPKDREPASLGDALRSLRNGIAHGNIDFLPGKDSTIQSLHIWNEDRMGHRTWGTIISVADLRRFLTRFVELADRLASQEIGTRMRRA